MKNYDFQPGDIVTTVIRDGESKRGIYAIVLGWRDPLHLVVEELEGAPDYFVFDDFMCWPEDWIEDVVFVKDCDLVSRCEGRKNDIIEANRNYATS